MNNTALLTAGNAIYSNKRAKKRARIEELTFDPEQRKYGPPFSFQISDCREYLTGFRKRKTQRQQKAAEFVKEQARKERIETRKEVSHKYHIN
jgi:ribosomal RNA-processing protein 17